MTESAYSLFRLPGYRELRHAGMPRADRAWHLRAVP